MLKLIKVSIVLIAILFSSLVLADEWWSVNANVTYSNTVVTAAVYNNLPNPIFCKGRAIGSTYYGQVIWSNFQGIIEPGMSYYVYVYTNVQNPFIGANANVVCKFY